MSSETLHIVQTVTLYRTSDLQPTGEHISTTGLHIPIYCRLIQICEAISCHPADVHLFLSIHCSFQIMAHFYLQTRRLYTHYAYIRS